MPIKLYNSYTVKDLTLENCLVTATDLGVPGQIIWRIDVSADSKNKVYYCLVDVPHGKVSKPQIVIGRGVQGQGHSNGLADDNIWDLVEPQSPDWWDVDLNT